MPDDVDVTMESFVILNKQIEYNFIHCVLYILNINISSKRFIWFTKVLTHFYTI